MPQVVSMARIQTNPTELPKLLNLAQSAEDVGKSIPGFISLTGWQSIKSQNQFMSLIHFDTEEGLAIAIDDGAMSEPMRGLIGISETPPDVHRIRLGSLWGPEVGDLANGCIGSISIRVATPGEGKALEEELRYIFQELQSINGFAGSMEGRRLDVQDEVVGFAFWDTLDAFEESIPRKSLYEVAAYKKVR